MQPRQQRLPVFRAPVLRLHLGPRSADDQRPGPPARPAPQPQPRAPPRSVAGSSSPAPRSAHRPTRAIARASRERLRLVQSRRRVEAVLQIAVARQPDNLAAPRPAGRTSGPGALSPSPHRHQVNQQIRPEPANLPRQPQQLIQPGACPRCSACSHAPVPNRPSTAAAGGALACTGKLVSSTPLRLRKHARNQVEARQRHHRIAQAPQAVDQDLPNRRIRQTSCFSRNTKPASRPTGETRPAASDRESAHAQSRWRLQQLSDDNWNDSQPFPWPAPHPASRARVESSASCCYSWMDSPRTPQ